jgi:hypothetical protein
MNGEKVTVTSQMLNSFCYQFLSEVKELKEILISFNINIKDALPSVFNAKGITINAVYSHDRQHVLISFTPTNESAIRTHMLMGDVFNYLDPYGEWAKMPGLMNFTNVENLSLRNLTIKGGKPFEFWGHIDAILDDINFDIPKKGLVKVDYSFIFSVPVFIKKLRETKQFARDLFGLYWGYYQNKSKKYEPYDTQAVEYKNYLNQIKEKMEEYFFDEDIHEKEIDQFIEKNPVILERCLSLFKHIPQATLKNVMGIYKQDLKPDMIAYNVDEKRWTIVDYKRAKRKIIKKPGEVRTSFYSEVYDLKGQLKDYKKYFNESIHRDYFSNEYDFSIENPTTVGIIGRVSDSEINDFNEQLDDLPRWCNIIPYNYLYESFCRYIKLVKTIS